MADPGFVAAAHADSEQESLSQLSITIPVEASPGDRALLVYCGGPATPAEDPAGWTHLFTSPSATSSGYWMVVWEAEIGSQSEVDPGAEVTVELSGNSRIALGVYVAGPSEVAAYQLGSVYIQPGTPPFNLTSPTVLATDSGRAVHIYGINGQDSANDSVSWTADPATTERVDVASIAPSFRNATLMIADELVGVGETTGRVGVASHRVQAFSSVVLLSSMVDRPIATASTPTPSVAAGTTGVQLLGEAENGAGAPFSYSWRQISGMPVALSDPTAQNPTFTAPNDSTELRFGLTVTDSADVESIEATVTIQVIGASTQAVPIADITTDGWLTEPASAATVSQVLADNSDATYGYILDPSGDEPLEVALSELTPPASGNPVTIYVRASMVQASQAQVAVSLLEGASTVIAEFPPESLTQVDTVLEITHQLTEQQVASVTDWSDLRLRIVGTAS